MGNRPGGGLDGFRRYSERHAHENRRRYDAPADPWAVVRVDPGTVDRFAVVPVAWGLGRVRGGDWDRPEHTHAFDDVDMFVGLRERFGEGRNWADTRYHEWVAGRVDAGGFRGCDSLDEVHEEHYPRLDRLYDDIAERYVPNSERVYDSPADAESVHDLEPFVLVGRDGEVIWTEGFHRFVLADVAGVETVPVYVLRRHEAWQRTRDELAATTPGDRPPELARVADHPDARDVAGPADPA